MAFPGLSIIRNNIFVDLEKLHDSSLTVPFLESLCNSSAPKSNIQIKIWRRKAPIPAEQTYFLVFLTDSFISLSEKLLKTRFFYIKNTFPGPLIIGTFEKGAPALQKPQS